MEIALGVLMLAIIMTVFLVIMFGPPDRNTQRRQRIEAQARQAEWQMDQMTRTTLGQMLDEARRHRHE